MPCLFLHKEWRQGKWGGFMWCLRVALALPIHLALQFPWIKVRKFKALPSAWSECLCCKLLIAAAFHEISMRWTPLSTNLSPLFSHSSNWSTLERDVVRHAKLEGISYIPKAISRFVPIFPQEQLSGPNAGEFRGRMLVGNLTRVDWSSRPFCKVVQGLSNLSTQLYTSVVSFTSKLINCLLKVKKCVVYQFKTIFSLF